MLKNWCAGPLADARGSVSNVKSARPFRAVPARRDAGMRERANSVFQQLLRKQMRRNRGRKSGSLASTASPTAGRGRRNRVLGMTRNQGHFAKRTQIAERGRKCICLIFKWDVGFCSLRSEKRMAQNEAKFEAGRSALGPQRLKPRFQRPSVGTVKTVPLQHLKTGFCNSF